MDYFYTYFSRNIITRHEDKMDWKLVSGHPYLPINMVEKYSEMPWDWRQISRLPFQSIQRLILQHPHKEWDWHVLTESAPLSFKTIHYHFPWNHKHACVRKYSFETYDIQLNYALLNSNSSLWNWNSLSHHPSLTMDIVCQNLHLHWNMSHILTYIPFSSHHLNLLPTTNHHYSCLSKNLYNTIQIVCRHKTKPWDWTELAQNVAFAPHHIYRHCRTRFPMWRWDLSLRNPRLTWDFYHMIRKEKKIPRQFQHLFRNNFHHSKLLHIYCCIVIQRFIIRVAHKRNMMRKLRFLNRIRKRLNDDMMRAIVFDFIG